MKKTLLLVIYIAFFYFFPSYAMGNNNIDKVFMVEAYKFDDVRSFYDIKQYGSAVYLDTDLIYTNAHVVLDEDNIPIGNYRVCKTTDFKKAPICFSVGELLYYDIKNDLAVLKISMSGSIPVTKSKKTLNIGDTVQVYGYPMNGGETITYTEGKISGYENGLYKVDANIDAGNSGGGVFDEDGNLIGLAVSVKIGYSSLGYIIPLEKINEFQKRGDASYIEEYNETINRNFLAYNALLKSTIGSGSLSNNEIDITGLSAYGFSVKNYIIDNSKKYYAIELSSENYDTSITIKNIQYKTPDNIDNIDDIYEMENRYLKLLKKKEFISDYKIRKTKKGDANIIITFAKNLDGGVEFTIIIEGEKRHYQKISTYSDNIKNKSFLNGIKISLGNIKIKKISSDSSQSEYNKFTNLTIQEKEGFYVSSNLWGDTLNYLGKDIEIDATEGMKIKTEDISYSSLSDMTNSLYNLYKGYLYTNNFEIKKTDSGDYYIYMFSRNNLTRLGSEVKDEKKYFISAIFLDSKDDETTYKNTLSFTFDKTETKETIDTFLRGIKTSSGKLPFELGNLKVGENLIKEDEFEFK